MWLIHSEINQLRIPCEHNDPKPSSWYASTYSNCELHGTTPEYSIYIYIYLYGLFRFCVDKWVYKDNIRVLYYIALKHSHMWMYFATLAYFLCGVYIIPERHWGEGLKPGMHTISPQEAKHGRLPSPHAQISPSHAQLAGYWIIVEKSEIQYNTSHVWHTEWTFWSFVFY